MRIAGQRKTGQGESCAVIATGLSLTAEDCEEVAKARREGRLDCLIGVNDAYRICPDLDHLYAADARWWRHHRAAVEGKAGVLWTTDFLEGSHAEQRSVADDLGVNIVKGERKGGLGKSYLRYGEGGNSGYQAINLAYLFGYRRIILLGFDMYREAPGKTHFFGEHPQPCQGSPDFEVIVPNFEQLADDLAAEGVEVINCTRSTKLPYFPRADLETCIAH